MFGARAETVATIFVGKLAVLAEARSVTSGSVVPRWLAINPLLSRLARSLIAPRVFSPGIDFAINIFGRRISFSAHPRPSL